MTTEQLQRIEAIGSDETELARYRAGEEERCLVGRRTPAGIEIADHPVTAEGNSHEVDSGYMDPSELAAFVDDYLVQAARLGACPMSREAIARMLDRDPAAPTL